MKSFGELCEEYRQVTNQLPPGIDHDGTHAAEFAAAAKISKAIANHPDRPKPKSDSERAIDDVTVWLCQYGFTELSPTKWKRWNSWLNEVREGQVADPPETEIESLQGLARDVLYEIGVATAPPTEPAVQVEWDEMPDNWNDLSKTKQKLVKALWGGKAVSKKHLLDVVCRDGSQMEALEKQHRELNGLIVDDGYEVAEKVGKYRMKKV